MWAAAFTYWVEISSTSTTAVKLFHSTAVEHGKTLWYPAVWIHRTSRRRSDTTFSKCIQLLQGTRSTAKVIDVLRLSLMQLIESADNSSVLQGVQQCAGSVMLCAAKWLLLLLLLVVVMSLLTMLLLPLPRVVPQLATIDFSY